MNVDHDIWLTAQRPGRPAELKIDCLVLGGGLCGLATAIALKRSGHNVTVVERDPVTNKRGTGGGCRLPPNMTKVLFRWGMGQKLIESGGKLHFLHMHVYETGEFLGNHNFPEPMLKEAGGDYVLIQYGDLWQILYEGALEAGAEILTGADVTSVDPASGSVTVANGDVLTADVIIATDGPRGHGRRLLREQDEMASRAPKSFMMHEATIPVERIARYPELVQLTKVTQKVQKIMLYWGAGCAIHLFPISQTKKYSLQYCVDDDGTAGEWGDKPHMKLSKVMKGCEPRLQALAQLADDGVTIHVPDNFKLDHWVHHSQRLIVIGEAAHPFPPAAQQGIAMALEDAAVLGKLFSHLKSKSQIGSFLYALEDLRQSRCYTSLQEEVNLFHFFAMRSGPKREARDSGLKESHGRGLANLSDVDGEGARQWEDVKQVYQYDCEDEADEWWIQWGLLREQAAVRNKYYIEQTQTAHVIDVPPS